jgi:hypothetical protein
MVGFAILGKAANFRGEEGKKKKNKYRSCGIYLFIFLT